MLLLIIFKNYNYEKNSTMTSFYWLLLFLWVKQPEHYIANRLVSIISKAKPTLKNPGRPEYLNTRYLIKVKKAINAWQSVAVIRVSFDKQFNI